MAGKKKAGVKSLEFLTPAFRHVGIEYISADFEKAIQEGSEEHVALVPELIKLGQIVEVDKVEEETSTQE